MKTAITVLAVAAMAVTILWALSIDEGFTERGPVRIAAIQPLSKSTVATGEQVREGIELGAANINEQGGINGRRLEVVYEDDQCDAKTAVTAFEKLANIDKIRIVIGPTCSSNVLAVAPLANEKKVIVLTTVASTPKVTHAGDYIFRNTPSGDAYSNRIAEFARSKLDARTASVLFLNLDNGVDYKNAFVKRFAELGGSIMGEEAYEPTAADFRSQLAKIRAQNPDVLFVAGQINHGTAIKQAREMGLMQQIIGPVTMETSDFVPQAGTAAEGVVYSAPKFDKNDPAVKAFEEKYMATYNKTLGFRTLISYDATMIIASLLGRCGEDVECVKNGLYVTQNYTGVAGTYSFDRNGDVAMPIMLKTVRNGKFVPYEG